MKKDSSSTIPATTLIVVLAFVATLHSANSSNVNENEAPVRYDGVQLWRIHNITDAVRRQAQISLPELLENNFGANIWRDYANYIDVSIDKKHVAAAKSFLQERKLTPELLNANVQTLFDNEVRHRSKRSTSGMNWNDYQSLETIYTFLKETRDKHPDICTLFNIGQSAEGRPLWVLRISENTNNTKIWIDGGIHAREWISPATVTFIISQLLTKFQDKSALIIDKTWYIMPVVNPDGYVYTRDHNRLWRKNRANNGGHQCKGVDLNRNFNINWNAAGSSQNPCSDVFRGPSAGSEPETTAVTKFLTSISDNLGAYLTYHSYSQAITYPWAYTFSTVDNAKELQCVGDMAANYIYKYSGKIFKVGPTHRVLGTAGGGSDDWTRYALNTRFVYTIELRDRGEYGFALPPSQIRQGAQEGTVVAFTVAAALNNNCSSV